MVRLSWLLLAALSAPVALAGPRDHDDDDDDRHIEYTPRTDIDFEGIEVSGDLVKPSGSLLLDRRFAAAPAQMGATPGGTQDITWFRAQVDAGSVPPVDGMSPEGLFSEHDLPLDGAPCHQLLCVQTAAAPADLLAQDDVAWLAQLGFSSGLDPRTYRRPPLNLVLVVDRSGSMDGEPIAAVREALSAVRAHLDARDQVAIVAFDSGVADVLAPTRGDRADAIDAAVATLQAGGSTNLVGGLERGFAIARSSRRAFDGVTRVVVMTDEQPNVGAVDDRSFMGLARTASADGIGLTTFGIGMGLDPRLMGAISAVRGGNAVSFPSVDDVAPRLNEDFDTLFTELAYDLRVELVPADGVTVTGVYGVPGAGVEWMDGGGIALSVETVFASKERGGLYVGLDGASRGALATATVTYTPRDGGPGRSVAAVHAADPVPVGLSRGAALVDVATGVRAAVLRYHDGDVDGAAALVRRLEKRVAAVRDDDLDAERDLLRGLLDAMRAPDTVATRDPVTGLPR